jgi:HSP20 family protein
MANQVTTRSDGGRLVSRYADPFQALRSEMDRLFEDFFGGTVGFPRNLPSLPAERALTPRLDVKENEKEIVVQADLPGIDEKDINLTLQNGILSLTGEKKSERDEKRENYHLMERSYGSFQRSIRLPEGIDEDRVQARFDKGVLTVTLPKRPELAKAQKKIEIKSA